MAMQVNRRDRQYWKDGTFQMKDYGESHSFKTANSRATTRAHESHLSHLWKYLEIAISHP